MNTAALREVVKHRNAVITYGRDPEAKLPEIRLILLQLDQLGLAIWSPIRGPVEQNDSALWPKQIPQVTNLTVLILQLEPGHLVTYSRAVVPPGQTKTNH